MQKWLRHTVPFIFLAAPVIATGQASEGAAKLESIVESLAESLEAGTDASMIEEDLTRLLEEPLNFNVATQRELSKLHLLNDIQIRKLLDYREKFGPVYSIFELNAIDGFSPGLLKKMQPFIRFGPQEKPPRKWGKMLRYGRHEMLVRTLGITQTQRGYREKADGTIPFEGNPLRYYARYRFRAKEALSAGFTAEKDPGEAFFSGSNKKGFDFYSAHLSISPGQFLKNITFGDYVVRAGQGLVLWQGFSAGKSVYALDISKTNQGIRPFTSTNENQFFRGVGATLNVAGTRLHLFYSNKKTDANLVLKDSSATVFTSLPSSGYHRTVNEIADKNSIKDRNTGLVASRQMKHLKVGITFLYRRFNAPFDRKEQLYNRFRFGGTENYAAGANYLFSKGDYQLFGEAAVSRSKGKAFLQGVLGHLHDRLQISALFRHLDRDYQALWAGPFAQNNAAGNETGLYFGTRILPVKYVTLTAYTDIFRSKWIEYTTAAPSTGREYMAQATFRFSERFHFYIRLKNKTEDRKYKDGRRKINREEQTLKSRIHFTFHPWEPVRLKTRLEHACHREGHESENGFLIFQDVQVAPDRIPGKVSARLAWFNTPGYASRIYAYENDLLYTFSIPAFWNKGIRSYLNLKYKINEKTEVWFKWANSLFQDTESIGSGYNEIRGNKKTEVKFQVRLKI